MVTQAALVVAFLLVCISLGIFAGIRTERKRRRKVVDDFVKQCADAIESVEIEPVSKKKVSKKKAKKKVSKKKVKKKVVKKKASKKTSKKSPVRKKKKKVT